jgi:hypothetical protein
MSNNILAGYNANFPFLNFAAKYVALSADFAT